MKKNSANTTVAKKLTNTSRRLKLASNQPDLQAETASGKSKLFQKFLKRRPDAFVFVVTPPDDLKGLLEIIYISALLQQKESSFKRIAMVDKTNQDFLIQTNLFDEVIAVNQDNIINRINSIKPTLLFSPLGARSSHLLLKGASAKIRLFGGQKNLFSFMYKSRHLSSPKDLNWLKQKGIDLTPEYVTISLNIELNTNFDDGEGKKYVWLGLFDNHILNGNWPTAHAARLARLLEKDDVNLVIPISPNSAEKLQSEIKYLKNNTTNVILVNDCGPQKRLSGMLSSTAVVAPAGPETLLASLIRKPVFLLHDMLSFRSYDDTRGLKLVDNNTNGNLTSHAKTNPLLFKISNSQEKHIKPSVVTCNNECRSCPVNACTESISPERVYEKVKTVFSPFSVK